MLCARVLQCGLAGRRLAGRSTWTQRDSPLPSVSTSAQPTVPAPACAFAVAIKDAAAKKSFIMLVKDVCRV
eukprot:COSAG04_NODE_2372_length_4253_cov_1.929466_2_plen_71_part_00